MDEGDELEIYQLFKRNRISLMDPTYKPDLKATGDNKLSLSWDIFDKTQFNFGVKNLGNISLADKSDNFTFAERGRSFYVGVKQGF